MQKLFKGSVLVYVLIIMMLLLVGALSLVTTTIIQQRSSSGTAESVRAFQLANDGSEHILAAYKRSPVSKISQLGGCRDGVVSKTIVTGKYEATFVKSDGTGMATSCDTFISDISEVKIAATVGSSTRAIQTAFATGLQTTTVYRALKKNTTDIVGVIGSGDVSVGKKIDNKTVNIPGYYNWSNLDGLGCDLDNGWKLLTCYKSAGDTGGAPLSVNDLMPYLDSHIEGCVSNDYDQEVAANPNSAHAMFVVKCYK